MTITYSSLELTTKLVLDANIRRDDPSFDAVRTAYEHVKEAIVAFQVIVWEGWLQETVGPNGAASFSATAGDLTLLVFATAGRVMMTLHRVGWPHRHITMLGAEKEVRQIGLQGINLTEDQAIQALRDACVRTGDLRKSFAPDAGVTLGVG